MLIKRSGSCQIPQAIILNRCTHKWKFNLQNIYYMVSVIIYWYIIYSVIFVVYFRWIFQLYCICSSFVYKFTQNTSSHFHQSTYILMYMFIIWLWNHLYLNFINWYLCICKSHLWHSVRHDIYWVYVLTPSGLFGLSSHVCFLQKLKPCKTK